MNQTVIQGEFRECEVCSRESEVFVHSSRAGPMSFASCRDCLTHIAEPVFVFHYLYDFVGTKGENLADRVQRLQTFQDGAYITWSDWVKWRRDPSRIAELDAKFDRDMEALNDETMER